jgi:peptidyl-prolyl cis-trans isomerase B (cyclophilin B)
VGGRPAARGVGVKRLLLAILVAAAAVRAGAAEGDLVLEAAAESKSVKLGEDAVLLVTLTNHAASAVRTRELRLARDSITVRVVPGPGGQASWTKLLGDFLEDDKGGLAFRPSATPERLLDPGESLRAKIAVPAVLSGDLTLTAVLAEGTPERRESKPVVVAVESRTGQPQHVAAQVETSRGSFRIDLAPAGAYTSVAHFWSLARDGYFNGLPFHRVLRGVLAQTGDPRGNGSGGCGWYVPAETAAPVASRGDVGLARGAHADSASSQWFVIADGKNSLAGGYVRLGTVGEGLEVVDALCANEVDAKTGRPRTTDRVLAVKTIVR